MLTAICSNKIKHMNEQVEKEIEAIKTVLNALDPLDEETRSNVLEYVLKKLKLDIGQLTTNNQGDGGDTNGSVDSSNDAETSIHIEKFKDQKQPKTDMEMAVLVAYYLQYVAPKEEKKLVITTEDLDTYFKIASYPIPTAINQLLKNTKNAGYIDQAAHGQYKLNAVGYNLVKHNMPRTDSGKNRKRNKRSSNKK
jgi:hypothetical protein